MNKYNESINKLSKEGNDMSSNGYDSIYFSDKAYEKLEIIHNNNKIDELFEKIYDECGNNLIVSHIDHYKVKQCYDWDENITQSERNKLIRKMYKTIYDF